MKKLVKVISITGTKGKTTTTHLLSILLQQYGASVLRVDSTGSYFNDTQHTTAEDSAKAFNNRSPNVFPERYIPYHAVRNFDSKTKNYAVLETSYSTAFYGVKRKIHTGIFINMYEEHLGFRIHTIEELYEAKSIVAQNIDKNGTYIASLDNEYTIRSFGKVPEGLNIKKIGITQNEDCNYTSLKKLHHLYDILYVKDTNIFSLKLGKVGSVKDFRYSFDGNNKGLVENLLCVFACLITEEFTDFDRTSEMLQKYLLPENYGRQLIFSKGNQTVVIDFAHEEHSLSLLFSTIEHEYQKPFTIIGRVKTLITSERIEKIVTSMKNSPLNNKVIFYDKIATDGLEKYSGIEFTVVKGRRANELAKIAHKLMPQRDVQIVYHEFDAFRKAINDGDKLIVHIGYKILPLIDYLHKENFTRIL